MKNLKKIKLLFEKYNITEVGIINTKHLIFQKQHLLNNKEKYKSCIVFCIPYRTSNNNPDNISKYCATYDYHLYFKRLYETISIELKDIFPNDEFIGFTDHSPINERDAAIKAGLGIIGKNSMIINKKYGSYIFIASIFSSLETHSIPQNTISCINCGKCLEACPSGALSGDFKQCLSHITQKKSKTEEELSIIKSNKYVWGCDICQDVCPHNVNVLSSPIKFFDESIINHLTTSVISEMNDEEFENRAFSWRGKKTILENLSLFDE